MSKLSTVLLPHSYYLETFQSLDKNLQQTIENAYSLLDYDKDNLVSISDLKSACNYKTEEEAAYLLKILKNPDCINTDYLTFEEFFCGILEYPCLLTQFSSEKPENLTASIDSIHMSINEEDDINTKICEVISVISLVVNSYNNYCGYNNTEELLEVLHELLILLKLKYRKTPEKRDMTKAIILLYSVFKLQNAKFSEYRMRTDKKLEDFELTIHNLTKKYEEVSEKNHDYLDKIIFLEKSLTKAINELDFYKKTNAELSTRCSIEESEDFKTSMMKKELEIVERKIRKFLALNMFIDKQRKTEPQHKRRQANKSHQYREIVTDIEKNHQIEILNDELKRAGKIINDKDDEIRFMLDMIEDLRQQIDELNEEKIAWIGANKFTKMNQEICDESCSSFQSIRETLDISCIESSTKYVLKAQMPYKDMQTQTCAQVTKSRNCLFWMS
ncbi:hypothetical protein SteCoe_29462 [Stentor coeruleus]|uniref:EF-hand domain-containing protein n=1 Tax=Stentor coeruleus TaxID=5963 RepID=A0A1R2B5U2_9CILI|nr:hypothetical protein SteCoe_29462 [Stentor coeruleus]